MKVLMLHNRYKIMGGEDVSTEAEFSLLKSHGIDVDSLFITNDAIDNKNKVKLAMNTIWSGSYYNEILDRIKEKKYDISVRNDFAYNSSKNSQGLAKINYNTNSLYIDGALYIQKVWSLKSDYQYNYRQKTTSFNSSINTNILNARLQRTFKHDEFTAYITVRDILNQNIGVDRSFNGSRYNEVINDRLKRYFLVGFTWDFKNKAPKPTSDPLKN